MTTGLIQQAAGKVDIFRRAGKGYRQIVHADIGRNLDIGLIFVCQRRRRQATTLTIDTLVIGEGAGHFHHTAQATTGHGRHAQHHATIVQQQAVVDAAIFRQIFIIDAHLLLVAFIAPQTGIERKDIADTQLNRAVFETGNANLRPL